MADVTVKYKGNVIAEMNGEDTKTLKTSGKYCESDIVVSYVPPASVPASDNVNCKIYELTLTKGSGWVFLTDLSSEVLAHINDPTFTAVLAINDEYSYTKYTGAFYIASNTPFGKQNTYPLYGYSYYQGSETAPISGYIYYKPNNTGTSTGIGGHGIFRVDSGKYYIKPGDYFIRAGKYRLIFTW